MKSTQTTMPRHLRAGLFALSTLCALLSVGCAGEATLPSGGGSTNPFTGTYKGSGELDNSKTGSLDLTVDASGDATGTLTVSAPTLPTRDVAFDFPAGTYSVSGTVSDAGFFSVSGTVEGTGSFGIEGDLSLSGSTSYTIEAGGSTFSGSIAWEGGFGNGAVDLTFSEVSGNVNPAAFPSDSFVGVTSAAGATAMIVTTGASSAGEIRNITVNILDSVAVGSSVNLNGMMSPLTMIFTQGSGAGADGWLATGGQAKVIKRNGTDVEIELIGAHFTSMTGSASGSFKLNGTIASK